MNFARLGDAHRADNDRLAAIAAARRARQTQSMQVEGFVRQLDAKKEDKRGFCDLDARQMMDAGKQLDAPFGGGSQLTDDEQTRLTETNAELRTKMKELDEVSRARQALETQKSEVENELEVNLTRRREAIQAVIRIFRVAASFTL